MASKKNANKNQTQGNRKCDNIDDIHAYYDEKFNNLKLSFGAKLETLHKIIDKKDDIIGKLQNDVGELRQSLNYLSGETSDLKKYIDDKNEAINAKVEQTDGNVHHIKEKTVDLEDRSRRSNLVFFNFPEASRGVTEDCEDIVENCLMSLKVIDTKEIWFERAHRLGRRRPEHDTKPRPIIVKFTYYKQKEAIIKNASKFRNSHINVSEDYSRETLDVHRKLYQQGKAAKENLFSDPVKAIKYFKVGYRRLTLTYSTNKNDPAACVFTRSVSLNDIVGNAEWLVPPQHSLPAPGYQDN